MAIFENEFSIALLVLISRSGMENEDKNKGTLGKPSV
jgi:hypothetical protein